MRSDLLAACRRPSALLRLLCLFGLLCTAFYQLDSQIGDLPRNPGSQPSPNARLQRLPYLGITVELESLDEAARRTALARLKSHGIGWVRQRVDWAQIEPAPGVYRWHELDDLVDAVEGADLALLLVLDGSPAWARDPVDGTPADTPIAPPASVMTFAQFAGAAAARYRHRIAAYQLWDEPNITPHWGNRRIEPVAYAQLLRQAASSIRAADSTAAILTAALAPTLDRGHTAIDEFYFLERMAAAGALTAVDAVAVEPFGFGDSAQTSPGRGGRLNFQRARLIRDALVAAGAGELPLIAVRFGWTDRPNATWRTVTSANQRHFAEDAVRVARSEWPWLIGMGWAIDQPGASQEDVRWGFAADDSLLDALAAGLESESSPAAQPPRPVHFLGALALLAVSLWRGSAAFRLLPWRAWCTTVRRSPPRVRTGIWAALLLLYHLTTWPPLSLFLLCVAAFLLLAAPRDGVLLAAALLPFHIQHKELVLVSTTLRLPPAQAILLALTPVLLGHTLDRRHRWRVRPPEDWLAAGWVLIGLATAVTVWHWPAYWRGLVDLVLTPVGLFVAVRLLTQTESERVMVAWALFAGGVAAAMVGLAGWMTGGGTEVDTVRRLVGPHFSPNHTALYLERALFVGLGLLASARFNEQIARRATLLLTTGVVLVTVAVALTFSRGALLLGLPAGLATMAGLAGRTGSTPRRQRLVALGAAGLIGMVLLGLLVSPRLANSATVVERMAIWRVTLDLWRATPLLGVGPDGFFWRFPAYIPVNLPVDPNLRHPHMIWLETAMLGGVVGLTWLVALAVFVVQDARRVRHRRLYWGLLAGLAAALAHGQVDAFQALPDLAGWNWMALGLLTTALRPPTAQGSTDKR